MIAKRNFKSKALEAVHSAAKALFEVRAINKATMRTFDAMCIKKPVAISLNQHKKPQTGVRMKVSVRLP